ncbi:hypothetical protein MtrunA17_Chr7g0253021 [Medicago truncatula]|uniref:Uncharacterized protein n=1 Tax=Medicago truncatula TaxID=3880 RepID=A0A396H2H0_MEDTR|nr:hypothetical protein MtrunA17_Chr7g0253021 [Medicago truncatula]
MTRFLRTKDSRGNEEKPVIVVTETVCKCNYYYYEILVYVL